MPTCEEIGTLEINGDAPDISGTLRGILWCAAATHSLRETLLAILPQPVFGNTAYGRGRYGNTLQHSPHIAPLPPQALGTPELTLDVFYLAARKLSRPSRLKQFPARLILNGWEVVLLD
ncbi:MAG: hypothetical protein WBC89_00395 [Dehalococcoidia bacterium]